MNDTIHTGGPAFPTRMEGGPHLDPQMIPGMTLRDYFAAKAMASLIVAVCANHEQYSESELAKCAYMHADAMLSVR